MRNLEQTVAHANAVCRELADRGMSGSIRRQYAIVRELIDDEFSAASGVEHMPYELLLAACDAAEENLVHMANKNMQTPKVVSVDEEG